MANSYLWGGINDQFWFVNTVATGSNFGKLDRNGTQSANATWGTGWTCGTTMAGYCSVMDYGVERAANTFVKTMLPNSGTPPDNGIGDCWRSEDTISATYLKGWWYWATYLIAVTNGSGLDCRIRTRFLKGTAADGSNAVEFAQAPGHWGVRTTLNMTVGTAQSVDGRPLVEEITFTNEYLFVQVALEIAGPATNVGADALWRQHQAYHGITTPPKKENALFLGFEAQVSSSDGYAAIYQVISQWNPGSTFFRRTGWTVGTTAPTVYSLMEYESLRAAGTFGATPLPDGVTLPDANNSFRSFYKLYLTANACTWTIILGACAKTNATGQDGRFRYRLWKGVAADGSDAVEFGGGTIISSTRTNIAVPAGTSSESVINTTATVALGAIVFDGEFLFVQVAWEITGAATGASADVTITSNYTPNPCGIWVPDVTYAAEPTTDSDPIDIIGISTVNVPLNPLDTHRQTSDTFVHWKFDEIMAPSTTLDSAAGGRNLTVNGTTTKIVPSPFGRSRVFDPAGSDYLLHAGDASFVSKLQGEWTIGCLVFLHPDFGTGTRNILSYGAYSDTQANNIQCLFGAINLHPQIIWEYGSSSPSDVSQYQFAYSLRHNQWYHLVFRKRDAGGGLYYVDLFVNGVLEETSGALTNCDGGSTANLNIGRYQNNGNYWYGMIDEIWMESISVQQSVIEAEWARIESHLNKSGPINNDGFAYLLYEFLEFSGDTIYDSSDMLRDLTVTGAFNITQGLMGRARQLDGVSQNFASIAEWGGYLYDVFLPGGAGYNSAVSVEAWIWIDPAFSANGLILSYGGTEGGQGSNLLWHCGINADIKAFINWQKGANVFEFTGAEGITTNALPRGEWVHVIWTRDPIDGGGGSWVCNSQIYVNGVLEWNSTGYTDGVPDGGNSATMRLVMGADARDGTSVFYGKINKLKVWAINANQTNAVDWFKLGPLGAPEADSVSTVTVTGGLLWIEDSIVDVLTTIDSLTDSLGYSEALTDTLVTIDSETNIYTPAPSNNHWIENLTDIVVITDSMVVVAGFTEGLTDTLITTDSSTVLYNMSEVIADTLIITDSETDIETMIDALADTLVIVDIIAGDTLQSADAIAISRFHEYRKVRAPDPNLT